MKNLPQDMTREEREALEKVLAQAIRSWDKELIQRCLEAGAEPKGLLSAAIVNKNPELVRQAVVYGADLNVMLRVSDRVYQPILHLAHDYFVPEVVEYLVKAGIPLDQKNSLGETVADRAALAGDFDKMRFYQERGADPSCGVNNIFLAAISRKRMDMVQWAVAQGADAKMIIRTNNGGATTVLHHALQNFQQDIFDFLLAQGISVDARDSAGNSPLMVAAGQSDTKITAFLLGRGADPLVRNYAGVSALENACLLFEKNAVYSGERAGLKENIRLMLGAVKQKHGVDPTNVLTRRDITVTGPLVLKKPSANDGPPSHGEG